MGADVARLKRHRDSRRLATLVATVTQLEATATDDALELLELLWATELAGKARTEADKGVIKKHPRLAKASAVLAVVAQVLLEARTWGEEDQVRIAEVRETIEARIAREQVRAAVATVTGMPPPEAAAEGDWRAEPAKRASTVVGLCRMLTATITFGANARGAPVLAAMSALGEQLGTEVRWSPGVRPSAPHRRVGGARRLHSLPAGAVLPSSETPRHLRRSLHPLPRSAGPAAGRSGVGGGQDRRADTLDLPEDPDALLAAHVTALDGALRYVGGRLVANSDVRVDGQPNRASHSNCAASAPLHRSRCPRASPRRT